MAQEKISKAIISPPRTIRMNVYWQSTAPNEKHSPQDILKKHPNAKVRLVDSREENKMDHSERILSKISEKECKRVSRKVIRSLTQMKDGLQAEYESVLKNIWDEICVQVQEEESFMWPEYLDTMFALVRSEVEKLDDTIKQTIWLQTDNGIDWSIENDGQGGIVYDEDEIANYILHDYVLDAAMDWSNKRIKKYFERFLE